MYFVVKGNIYHHQTPACQNMFASKHKKALKLREKHVQFKDEMKFLKAFQSVYHQPRDRCQDNRETRLTNSIGCLIFIYIFSVLYDVSVTLLCPHSTPPPKKKKRKRGDTTSDCSWCSGRSFPSLCGHAVGRMQRQVDGYGWEFQCFLH